jgi:nucleotide-binding universal stress UspA family protein
MKMIIAAVDFSNATPAVVENAVNLAKSLGANLQLFHSVEPEPGYATYGFTMAEFPAMGELHEETRRRATRLLADLLAAVKKDMPYATSHMAFGSPLHELLDHIKQTSADFVVVGSHGHGVIGALLLGSVAEGMVRKATVPTLVVPASPESFPGESPKAHT